MTAFPAGLAFAQDPIDAAPAWRRLALALLAATIGGVSLWSVVVVLPAAAVEFGATRGMASLAYTCSMVFAATGGVVFGRLSDRAGMRSPMLCAAALLGAGYAIAAMAPNIAVFILGHALLGAGGSVLFGPLIADTSRWFLRYRGIAVSLCACGNYIAGAVWPPLIQYGAATHGWRAAYLVIALLTASSLVPMALVLASRPAQTGALPLPERALLPIAVSPRALQILLAAAGLACCLAMAMPQVDIVAYCGDLGFGAAHGAAMLSLMLGLGVVSRIGSGFIADRIGGLPTLLLGSALQGSALLLYALSTSLASLYIVSALFGLFQGGLVPSYAIVIREYFPQAQAGARVGLVLMMTLLGMALGGFLSGVIFDLTHSYRLAFIHGAAWNIVNLIIVLFLFLRSARHRPALRGEAMT
jgi:MFS family permease